MKYKVGDRVRIRKDLECGWKYGNYCVAPQMQNLGGKITRIAKVFKDAECYRIKSYPYNWTDEMFEDVGTEVQTMKHKIGDKVRIRKDLEVGIFYGGCLFVRTMHDFVGEEARITSVSKRTGCYRLDLGDNYWTDEMFEDKDMEVMKMNKRVVINVDGNKVVAHCVDKEGVARCHPDDTFDFYAGAKIALERLEEAEKPYGWLKDGMKYYVPHVTFENLYDEYAYDADVWDKRVMERGIVFRTKEEAIECAKKMIAFIKQEG